MIKEAIDRILELKRPETFVDRDSIERFTATNKVVGMPTQAHEPVLCSSLESLCEFANQNIINVDDGTPDTVFFEITGPSSVSLIGINEYDGQEKKESICNCKAILPKDFPFGQFIEIERFIILACDFFERNDAFKDIIATVSSITNFQQSDIEDDGLSQTVTTKSGVGRKDKKIVSPFHDLRAYRTFREIDQPEASYLLRIQEGASPLVALFEASGYHWKIASIDAIARFISEKIHGALVMK